MKFLVLRLLECSLVMSALCVGFGTLETHLGTTYSARWRHVVWTLLLAGFALPWKPAPLRAIYAVSDRQVYQVIETVTGEMHQVVEPDPLLEVWAIAALVWLVGACVSFLWKMHCHFAFMEQAKQLARWETSVEIRNCVDAVVRELGIRSEVEVSRLRMIKTPMMAGYLRPHLLLPEQAYDPEALRLIVKHELLHFKRGDLWVKLLIAVVEAIHWFNPVMGWVRRRAEMTCELACDERVMEAESTAVRKAYCAIMLQAVREQLAMRTVLMTGFGSEKKYLKARLEAVLDARRRKRYVGLLLAIALAVGCSGFLFGRKIEAKHAENDWEATTSETVVQYDWEPDVTWPLE